MKLMSRSTTRDLMLLRAKSLRARPSVPPTREDAGEGNAEAAGEN